jgi:hypothetical protein
MLPLDLEYELYHRYPELVLRLHYDAANTGYICSWCDRDELGKAHIF